MLKGLGPRSALDRQLAIEYLGAPVLRRVAAPVTSVDGALRELIGRMFVTMYAAGGQGLAGPQIGRSIRLAVVDVPPNGPPYVLINPRLTWASDALARGMEGCLSIPGVTAAVARPAQVVVEALDLESGTQLIGAEGELARCLQHEIDHLDGILYIDRLSALSRRLTVDHYRKHAGKLKSDAAAGGTPHDRRRTR